MILCFENIILDATKPQRTHSTTRAWHIFPSVPNKFFNKYVIRLIFVKIKRYQNRGEHKFPVFNIFL